ncbi:MAG: sugar phosphate nucleotidyltransferase, partial [Rhodothermales bacterium]|nr:sugar phosphate nucleotidyltransferase [Rhodothermales bacterium]
DPDATMIVLPADHIIRNVEAFHRVLRVAVEKAQDTGATGDGALVTIGIEPTHPETGYGYIQFGDEGARGDDEPQAHPVRAFAEKPDLATAERFLDSGDFLWNSGMFIWRADAILRQFERHLPEVHAAFEPVRAATGTDAAGDAVAEAFRRSPKISIDYGVMERAAAGGDVFVVPGSFGWSDVGDWRAVYDLREKDQAGNAVEGNVILHDASRCYVRGDDRLLVLVGIQDAAVVDTGDAVLVCNLDSTQQVKNIVDYLGSHGLEHYI